MFAMTRRLKKGRAGPGVRSRRELGLTMTIRDVTLSKRRPGVCLPMLMRQVLMHTPMRHGLRGGR